ncbi:MAG: hypothetical protein RLN96_03155, partial [Pseudomonadales bacterium]
HVPHDHQQAHGWAQLVVLVGSARLILDEVLGLVHLAHVVAATGAKPGRMKNTVHPGFFTD